MNEALREVEAYLFDLAAVRDAIERRYPGGDGLAGFRRLRAERAIDKSGTVENGLDYNFHGIGCLFVIADEAEVDVDFTGGVEIFDPWRVRVHTESVDSTTSSSLAEIMQACRSMVSRELLVEPSDGWFSIVR